MDVLSPAAVAAPVARRGFIARMRARFAGVLVSVAFLVGLGGSQAHAATVGTVVDPTDPTGGAGDTFFTSLSSYLTGHLIASVLTLAVIGVSVSMLLSWGRKAAKSK